ncbi:hypothetical protein [Streptomyces griseosporeus]|uniref:hypothetical protein n=1 Tax=Streptomyces griseosporeus TaxID=1910 RepID=UPI0037BC2CB6
MEQDVCVWPGRGGCQRVLRDRECVGRREVAGGLGEAVEFQAEAVQAEAVVAEDGEDRGGFGGVLARQIEPTPYCKGR